MRNAYTRLFNVALCLLLVITSCLSAHGKNLFYCTELDIRNQVSSELSKYLKTPYSQGQSGWCGRYTANDLLSQKLGNPISALHTGVISILQGNARKGFFWNRDQTLGDGEHVSRVIKMMSAIGRACPTSRIPSHAEAMYRHSSGWDLSVDNISFYENLKKYQDGFCDEGCLALIDAVSPYFTGIKSTNSVKAFLDKYPDFPLENTVLSLMEHSCQKHFIKVPADLKVHSFSKANKLANPNAVLNFIDKGLESGRLVGISYQTAKIAEPTSFPKTAIHASVVVGRKSVDGECRYIVRNTWGTFCGYKKGIVCEPETGSYTVNRKTLADLTDIANYIE